MAFMRTAAIAVLFGFASTVTVLGGGLRNSASSASGLSPLSAGPAIAAAEDEEDEQGDKPGERRHGPPPWAKGPKKHRGAGYPVNQYSQNGQYGPVNFDGVGFAASNIDQYGNFNLGIPLVAGINAIYRQTYLVHVTPQTYAGGVNFLSMTGAQVEVRGYSGFDGNGQHVQAVTVTSH